MTGDLSVALDAGRIEANGSGCCGGGSLTRAGTVDRDTAARDGLVDEAQVRPRAAAH